MTTQTSLKGIEFKINSINKQGRVGITKTSSEVGGHTLDIGYSMEFQTNNKVRIYDGSANSGDAGEYKLNDICKIKFDKTTGELEYLINNVKIYSHNVSNYGRYVVDMSLSSIEFSVKDFMWIEN